MWFQARGRNGHENLNLSSARGARGLGHLKRENIKTGTVVNFKKKSHPYLLGCPINLYFRSLFFNLGVAGLLDPELIRLKLWKMYIPIQGWPLEYGVLKQIH